MQLSYGVRRQPSMPDKDRERFYFERLRNALPAIPAAPLVEREPPDFVVGEAPARLGIEFTVLHLPPSAGARPAAERHALKTQIMATAERMHSACGGPALYVKALFRPGQPLYKKDVAQLAEQVCDAVCSAPAPGAVSEVLDVNWQHLPREIASIRVRGSVNGEDRLWSADHAGWVAAVQPEQVQHELSRKAATAAAARFWCDQLWLVIVNDPFTGAAFAELADAAREAVYTHPFDRAIWLEPHEGRAFQLNAPPAV